MREIKFRTWNGKEIEYFTLDNNFDCVSGWLDGKILMQYTGLKDKNGVQIYEGDILQSVSGQNGVVVFENNTFGINGYGRTHINPFLKMNNLYWYIIGSIHENPKLI